MQKSCFINIPFQGEKFEVGGFEIAIEGSQVRTNCLGILRYSIGRDVLETKSVEAKDTLCHLVLKNCTFYDVSVRGSEGNICIPYSELSC